MNATTEVALKTIGANGQISLGKEFAGKQVMVEMREKGVWLIREAVVIPTNELYLHAPEARSSLERAVAAEEGRQPKETDLLALAAKLKKGAARGNKKNTATR